MFKLLFEENDTLMDYIEQKFKIDKKDLRPFA
jgi:hypothetical protein